MSTSTPLDIGSLDQLPPEIVLPILLQLPIDDLISVCSISRRYRNLCQDEYFWIQKAQQDIGVPPELFRQRSNLSFVQRYCWFQQHWQYWVYPGCEQKQSISQCLSQLIRNEQWDLLPYFLSSERPPHKFWEMPPLETALQALLWDERPDIVKSLVDQGMASSDNALPYVVADPDLTRQYLQKHPWTSNNMFRVESALRTAVTHRYLDTVRLILQSLPSLIPSVDDLKYAIQNRDIQIFLLLFQHRYPELDLDNFDDINDMDYLMQKAIYYGAIPIMGYLFDQGVEDPVLESIIRQTDSEILELLIRRMEHLEDPHLQTELAASLLVTPDLERLEVLLRHHPTTTDVEEALRRMRQELVSPVEERDEEDIQEMIPRLQSYLRQGT